jgi:hypothetical protein
MKPESEKWAKNLVYEMEHELKVNLTNNRSEHFLKNGVLLEPFSLPKRPSRRKFSVPAFWTLQSMSN